MVALAVLAFGCVFAATAGPRQASASQTHALRQTMTTISPLAQSLAVSAPWSGVSSSLGLASFGAPPSVDLTESQVSEVTGQLRDDFNHGVVRLAPQDGDWAGMVSIPHWVTSAVPATHGLPVRLLVAYRQPLSRHALLLAGRYPATPPPAARSGGRAGVGGALPFARTIDVLVSRQTARQFGLHAGSTMQISGPQLAFSGGLSKISLVVTGIVAPADPGSTFWNVDPTVITPDLMTPARGPSYWVGEVLADPGEIAAVQDDFGPEGLFLTWELPLQVGSLSAGQAGPLFDALTKLDAQTPSLTGDVAPIAPVLQVGNGLLQPLGAFIATTQAVDTLLWLLYVSLGVAGLVTLLLAARMVAMRRSAELAVRRARGASLPRIARSVAFGAAIACVPAAALAVALAVLLIPGQAPPGGWWPPAVSLAAVVCAPAVVAAWQQRLPRRARDRRRPRGRTRLVVEVTASLAAIAGIIVFRQQGTQPGSGVNLYTSAAPALIAVPAVIGVLRLYPLVLRGLLRGSARSSGAITFLGLARAARTALTPALPAFGLVLALTVAAFAGMVKDAVTAGEAAASWQAAGADVTVAGANANGLGAPVTPAMLRSVAAVPGVSKVAAVWEDTWTAPDDQTVTVIAVDPASYSALVAQTQTFPRIQAGWLPTRTPQPVLASPQAAADLGRHAATLTTQSGPLPVRVRVAGLLSGTPAAPGAAAFVVMPVAAIHDRTGRLPLNEMLITGAGIDTARLFAVLRRMLPAAVTRVRSDILKGLTGAPLQHGTFVLFEFAIVAAAALGLAVMLLELALGAAERETALARLAAMGLGEGQRARVVTLEVVPAVIAAAVAAAACAVVLPRVVAPAIDLSVFTGSGRGAVALAPDAASFTLPFIGLAVVAFVALGVEIRVSRLRGVARSIRAGE
jgi:putative ABC transport system permease protein